MRSPPRCCKRSSPPMRSTASALKQRRPSRRSATPEARAALIASRQQTDARAASGHALAAFPHQDAQDSLWEMSLTEKNPAILASIIKTWAAAQARHPSAPHCANTWNPAAIGRCHFHRCNHGVEFETMPPQHLSSPQPHPTHPRELQHSRPWRGLQHTGLPGPWKDRSGIRQLYPTAQPPKEQPAYRCRTSPWAPSETPPPLPCSSR